MKITSSKARRARYGVVAIVILAVSGFVSTAAVAKHQASAAKVVTVKINANPWLGNAP